VLTFKYQTGQLNSSLLCFTIFIRAFLNITRIQQYTVLSILYEEIKKTAGKIALCAGHCLWRSISTWTFGNTCLKFSIADFQEAKKLQLSIMLYHNEAFLT